MIPSGVTVGEYNGKLIDVQKENSDQIQAFVLKFGKIFKPVMVNLDADRNHPTTVTGESIMLTPETEEHWLETVVRIAKSIFLFDPHALTSIATHKLLKFVQPATTNGSAHEDRSIRGLEWHPYLQIVAVAKESSVYFYNANAQEWDGRVLEHRLQQNIKCLDWAPNSGGILAIGCENGLFLWDAKQNSSCLLDMLQYTPNMSVDCLSWSPDGRLIATASLDGTSVHIWDVTLRKYTRLKTLSLYPIKLIKWSPNGRYLFASTVASPFFIWECQTWRFQKWVSGDGHCVAASWSPNSDCILLAFDRQSAIFPLVMRNTRQTLAEIDLLTSIDISKTEYNSPDGSISQSVGGVVQEIAWDPTGERLVISFCDIKSPVALYSVSGQSKLEISPRGFIRGPENAGAAVRLGFCKSYSSGALLSICWSNGQLNFYPMHFKS